MTLHSIPLEVLNEICRDIEQPKDLLALSMTSKGMWEATKPQLYRAIRTTKRFDVLALVKLLLRDPSIMPYVQSLHVNGWKKQHRNRREAAVRGQLDPANPDATFSDADAYGWAKRAITNRRTYGQGDVGAVRVLLSMLPHLRQLYVRDCCFMASWIDPWPTPASCSTSRKNEFSRLAWSHVDADGKTKIRGEFFFERLATPSLRNLRISDLYMGPSRFDGARMVDRQLEECGSNVQVLHLERLNCNLSRLQEAMLLLKGSLKHFSVRWVRPYSRHETHPGHYFMNLDLQEFSEILQHVTATLEQFEFALDLPVRDLGMGVRRAFTSMHGFEVLHTLRVDRYLFVDKLVDYLPRPEFWPPNIESIDFLDCGDWLKTEDEPYRELGLYETKDFRVFVGAIVDGKRNGKLPKLNRICLTDAGLAWDHRDRMDSNYAILYPIGKRPHRRDWATNNKDALKTVFRQGQAFGVNLGYAPLDPKITKPRELGRTVIDEDPFGLQG